MMGGLISKVMEGCVTPDVRMSTAAGVVQVRAGAVSPVITDWAVSVAAWRCCDKIMVRTHHCPTLTLTTLTWVYLYLD